MTELLTVLEIKKEFPQAQFKNKADVWWMRLLGKVAGEAFMSSFLTTIGFTVYLPSNWSSLDENSRVAALRHEREHLRQAKKYTRPVFALLYILPFFPVFFAYWRYRFEREAYLVSFQSLREFGIDYHASGYFDGVCKDLSGPAYLYPWFSETMVRNWFKKQGV